jgi:hypothetical protein
MPPRSKPESGLPLPSEPPRPTPSPPPAGAQVTDPSTWLLEVRLPAEVVKQGMEIHFMKRLLKYLWRTWQVRCTAFLDDTAIKDPNGAK